MTYTKKDQQPFPRGGDYTLPGGRIVRVTIREPSHQDDHVIYKATAYLLNADGTFAIAASGAPISTPETPHTVHKSGIAAGTHSIGSAWVKYAGPLSTSPIPDGWARGVGQPTQPGAFDGECYADTSGGAYQWTVGVLESIRITKVDELLRRVAAPSGSTY
ncbi:MAG: hypothetical protein KGL35_31510 [Bradyrhizobium sp.]|nr:hypothetical protein [Bradyrhizobium sp.]